MNLNQKQIKKRLSLILSLLLIISSVNISSAINTKFADVSDTHWASKVIAKWSGEDYDVLQGDGKGNFNPSKGLTLGEIMTVLSKTFGYVQKQETQVTTAWAKESVEKAIAAGIIPKTDKIDANKMITRQEAIKYIAIAFGIQSSQGNTVFIDDQDIDKQYKGYVKAFYDMGYIAGDNKDKSKAKFNPKANYTRAEAMQVIDNILSDIIDRYTVDKTYEKNIIIRKAGVNLHNIKAKQNIIIAQGVQDSNILIDKVQIGKSLIIYGGKDITVVSDKMIENTIINKPYKSVTLRGKFNTVTVHDKTTVHIIGKAEKIILLGSAKATLNGKEVEQTQDKDDKNQTPSKSTKPITKTPGGGGAGGGGTSGGGNTDTIGDNPSITVTTKFPTGTVEDNLIDVEYTAIPSKGAEITEVSYTINDSTINYIYLKGGGIIEPKGTLGKGRVLLVPKENTIVFKVVDSSGKSATFTVKETPKFDYGFEAPGFGDDEKSDFADPSKGRFVNNRITVFLKSNANKKQIQELVEYVDGRIIGKYNILNEIVIKIPKKTEEEIDALCKELEDKYPDIVDHVGIETFGLIGPTSITPPTNDTWWNRRGGFSFPAEERTWLEIERQWGMTAINAPEAWELLTEVNDRTKVGIIDSAIFANHEDLRIPNDNIFSDGEQTHTHATHVMGIIAAIQNNERGVAGTVNINRNNLYAYSVQGSEYSPDSIRRGLTWNVVNGCKVINVSLGSTMSIAPNSEPNHRDYLNTMNLLIARGYDYVITQSAGNSRIDSNFNGVFMHITEAELTNRILAVGASDIEGNMANFSNHGDRVDVIAPGVSIYSATMRDGEQGQEQIRYEFKNGTSMAAPHVAGVAAMVWAANPALSGPQVKDIIVRSANNRGRIITDGRHTDNPRLYPRAEYREINAEVAVQLARGEEPENNIGKLVGIVIRAKNGGDNSLNDPISNARIILYKKSTDPKKQKGKRIKSVKSDNDGYYRMNNIEAGDYVFTVEADGYEIETVNVKIEDGVTTNVHKLKLVTKSDKKGKSTGKITNATTGLPVSEAITLEFRHGIDPDLTESAEVIKSENGRYSIELPAGNYTVTAKADGYITSTRYVVSYGDDITSEDQDIVILPNMIQGESSLRAVLTWGETPHDLDSHLIGPKPDDRKFHLCFYRKNTYYKNEIYNTLDVDDTYSFGPETVTINKLVDGTYDYYVHDFTNRYVTSSPQLSVSEAMVQVYDNNGMLKTFKVPLDQKGTVWHVFTLIVKDNRYTVIPVDSINDLDLYQYDTNDDNSGEIPTEPIPDPSNPTDPIPHDPSDPIPTDPIPEPPPNSTGSNESNQGSDVNSPNSVINDEEKEDSKIQSRKQGDIDGNNSYLNAKKDDSDTKSINPNTTNN